MPLRTFAGTADQVREDMNRWNVRGYDIVDVATSAAPVMPVNLSSISKRPDFLVVVTYKDVSDS